MKTKILIVEDHVLTAKDIETMLLKLGYQITDIAKNGDIALQSFQLQKPHLILMDIGLRGSKMDGIQIAEAINKIDQIPLIYLTGDKSKETIARAAHTHPSNYIIKPFTPAQLEAAIDVALINFFGDQSQAQNQAKNSSKKKEDNFFVFNDHIFVNTPQGFTKIHKSQLLFFEAHSNQSKAFTTTTKMPYLLYSGLLKLADERLGHFEELVRIHRSYIINISHVQSFSKKKMEVYLSDHQLPIGKAYYQNFIDKLGAMM